MPSTTRRPSAHAFCLPTVRPVPRPPATVVDARTW
jgi:hypothetical protein